MTHNADRHHRAFDAEANTITAALRRIASLFDLGRAIHDSRFPGSLVVLAPGS